MTHSGTSPAGALRQRLIQLRGSKGWSQDEIAERMTSHGYPWSRTTVAKIEGDHKPRQVTVNELVALAFVLGVPPIALLTPQSGDAAITNTTSVLGISAWQWMSGNYPMGGSLETDPIDENFLISRTRFYEDACPDLLAESDRRLPGVRALVRDAATSLRHAGVSAERVPTIYPSLVLDLEQISEAAIELAARAKRVLAKTKTERS